MASAERRAVSRRGGRGGAPEVVTIFWRDIPAQVNGQVGRDRHQVLLSAKFQRAVDRAKRKAGIYTADDDIAQWRRTSAACDGDVAAAANAEAARLEATYSREYLGRLAYAGGHAADVATETVDAAELLALEELDEADLGGAGTGAEVAPHGDREPAAATHDPRDDPGEDR